MIRVYPQAIARIDCGRARGGLHGLDGLQRFGGAREGVGRVFARLRGDGGVCAKGGGCAARAGGGASAKEVAGAGAGGEKQRETQPEQGGAAPVFLGRRPTGRWGAALHGLIFWSARPSLKSWISVSNFTRVVPMNGSLRVMTSPSPNFS